VEGFIAAYTARDGITDRPDTVVRVLRQRMVLHQHPDAVADALKAVPRSEPFAALTDLQAIHVPTVVVADHDGVDPGHPLAVGEAWAEALPDAELVVEEPGQSPIAWQGGAVSRIIAEVGQRAREDHR
jgi:pimeloyl-ACP methyl ester carboxylesterase